MKRLWPFFAAVLLFLPILPLHSLPMNAGSPVVSILLQKESEVVVESPAGFFVSGMNMNAGSYSFFADNGIIRTANDALGSRAVLSSPSPVQYLSVDGKPYRGEIVLQVSGGTLSVINRVDLETYLYGVVGEEMPGLDLEALKAQAVASRTLAMSDFLKGGTLRSTVSQQVYGGVDGERPASSQAVDDTRGTVLTYNGKLVSSPLFFSTCGGQTENSQNVFGRKVPYLQSVADSPSALGPAYCAISPYFRWSVTFSQSDLTRNLSGSGITGEVQNVFPAQTDDEGRVKALSVQTTRGEWVIRGFDIREVFRQPDGKPLNSTWFTVQKDLKDGEIYFQLSGKGEGHGVGLCQWGAIGMARAGKTYQEILAHYYEGTALSKLY